MKPADRLRQGDLKFEQALPLLERADAAARELAAELASRAEGTQVPTLLAAAAAVDARDRNAIQRFTVARELLARGRPEHVFDQPWPLSQLIALGPHAVEHLEGDALRAYFAAVSPRLADVAAGREPADTRAHFGCHTRCTGPSVCKRTVGTPLPTRLA